MSIRKVKEDEINQIVADIAAEFRCFGRGPSPSVIEGNPIAAALVDHEPQFAAGVDVREVVEYVVSRL